MTQQRSIVGFLSNANPVKYATPQGIEYYSAVSAADLKAQLTLETYLSAKQAAISARHDATQQNALHYVLSNKVFDGLSQRAKVISPALAHTYGVQAETRSAKWRAAKSRLSSLTAEIAEFRPSYRYSEYRYDRYHFDNWHSKYKGDDYKTVSNDHASCKCKSCVYSAEQKALSVKEIPRLTAEIENEARAAATQDAKALEDAKPTHGQAHFMMQSLEILKLLLETYNGDDEHLVELLLAKDRAGNTPLYYAFTTGFNIECFVSPLMQRVGALKENHKELLAIATNISERNAFHLLLSSSNSEQLKSRMAEFTHPVAKMAMSKPDGLGNTGLHEVLLPGSNEKLKKIASIAPLFKQAEVKRDVKADAGQHLFSDLFRQNKNKKNPLHLAAAVKVVDDKFVPNIQEEIDILKEVIALCPPAIYVAKLREKDSLGNTPLHDAVMNGPVEKVRLMIASLTNDEKHEIANMANHKSEKLLHFACRFGNRAMLDEVVKMMGQQALFELRFEAKNDFTQERVQNNRMSEGDYQSVMRPINILLDIYADLIARHGRGVYLTTKYKERAKEFKTSLETIASGGRAPDVDPNLSSNTQKYDKRRELLREITAPQAKEFLIFLNNQARQKNASLAACQILGIDPKKPALLGSSTMFAGSYGENTEGKVRMVIVKNSQIEGQAPKPNAPSAPGGMTFTA